MPSVIIMTMRNTSEGGNKVFNNKKHTSYFGDATVCLPCTGFFLTCVGLVFGGDLT